MRFIDFDHLYQERVIDNIKRFHDPRGVTYANRDGFGVLYIYIGIDAFLIKFLELSLPKPQIVEIRSDQGSIANRWYCVLVDLSSQKIVT